MTLCAFMRPSFMRLRTVLRCTPNNCAASPTVMYCAPSVGSSAIGGYLTSGPGLRAWETGTSRVCEGIQIARRGGGTYMSYYLLQREGGELYAMNLSLSE